MTSPQTAQTEDGGSGNGLPEPAVVDAPRGAITEAVGSGMVDRIEAAIVAKMGVFISPSRRRDMARAMLEAMKEPTDEMLIGLGKLAMKRPAAPMIDKYHAMIDAALEESET